MRTGRSEFTLIEYLVVMVRCRHFTVMLARRDAKTTTVILLVLSALLGVVGCGRRDSERRLQKALADAGLKKIDVVPFAGRVTIDGESPKLGSGDSLLVVLRERDKIGVSPDTRLKLFCDRDGNFAATSYFLGDGMKPGQYVVTFALFRDAARTGLTGPDQLKNLYNDPDKNLQIPELNIDHKSPGKRDYAFDLQVAGR